MHLPPPEYEHAQYLYRFFRLMKIFTAFLLRDCASAEIGAESGGGGGDDGPGLGAGGGDVCTRGRRCDGLAESEDEAGLVEEEDVDETVCALEPAGL